MQSALNVTVSCVNVRGIHAVGSGEIYLHWRHDLLYLFRVKFQDAVEDRNFIITKRIISSAMELEE